MAIVLDLKSIRGAAAAGGGEDDGTTASGAVRPETAVPLATADGGDARFDRRLRERRSDETGQSLSQTLSQLSTPARIVIVVVVCVLVGVAIGVTRGGSTTSQKAVAPTSPTTPTPTPTPTPTSDPSKQQTSETTTTPPAASTGGKLLNANVPVKPGTVAFVTGANSMIGSYVCRSLLDRGYTVHAMVRFRSNLRNLGGILDQPRFKLVYGDLIDPYRMAELILSANGGADGHSLGFVYHFAAQAINGVSFGTPSLSTQVNVQGTLHLLEAVRALPKPIRESVRVLVAGSSTEYGRTADTYDTKPMPESAPFDPVTPYGVSKVATEYLARMYWNTYKIQCITARFFIQVAAGGTEHLALQEFSRQIAMIERGLQRPVLSHGNLETQRDMTDIADAAPVVVALAELGVAGEGYNVCTGVAHKMSSLLAIAVGLSSVKIEVKYDDSRARPFDEKMMLGDPTKLIQLTGWKPSVDMTKTTKQVLDYWRAEVEARYPLESRVLVAGATPSPDAKAEYDRAAAAGHPVPVRAN